MYKLIILITIILSQSLSAEYVGTRILSLKQDRNIVGEVYMQILNNTQHNPAHEPLKLAEHIVNVAREYNLDPLLLSAIAALESNYYVGAINKRTADYGIMQINAHNVKHYKFSKKRLLTDIEYSLRAGAIVLSWFKLKYERKEPGTWYCRYNIGVRALKGKLRSICLTYVSLVRARY